ncbi:hypothetical protein [Clostridium sp.]|uniref:hypothetical protein n=1 Tax=Clostridium sp. TaxID=1506 RepID=UPI002912965B|nr:hypothetical protein [Clostridium sp.]MDU5105428.1 hypothetical protein [Clostridium sp.]
MISNYLYLISIGLVFMTIIFIIYNYILLGKRKKADHKDDNNKENIIKNYKKNIMNLVVILIVCISFAFYFSRPVDIYKTVNIGKNINYEKVNVYGNITSFDMIELDSGNGEKVFDLLEKYKYKRICNFSDATGGDAQFILFENTDGKPGIIEVWRKGYIRIPNHKVYKVESEDKEELYGKLSSLLKNL